MRVKVDYRSGSRNNYKIFCQEHPDLAVSYEDWKFVIYRFNQLFREHILETGEKIRMPGGFGDFSITKKKRKKVTTHKGKEKINLPIDWQKTRKAGKKVYNFNHHTEGFFFGWIWFRRTSMVKHVDLWKFKPSRETSRILARYIKSNDEYQHKYCEWTYK